MKVAFIGLGNVGGKLAGSLLRNGADLAIHDLDVNLVSDFVTRGATAGADPAALMQAADVVITCLPSPAASNAVVTRDASPSRPRQDVDGDVHHPMPRRSCASAPWWRRPAAGR